MTKFYSSSVGKNLADEIIKNGAEAPSVPDDERKTLLEEVMRYRISVKDEYPHEQNVLSINGVGFFALGDVHAIKAKQKQGKTNAIAIMVAAIISGQWGPLKAEMSNAKVLVIDTEQKAADTQLFYRRILSLAGLPEKDIFDRLQVYHFRPLEKEKKLLDIKALIEAEMPDIVFIDGIVDLLHNFNDVDDSQTVIEELMRMCTPEVSGKSVSIVCVLHTNKSSDDHGMRGHAGTMLAQRAGNVFEVSKKDGIFTVSNTDSRHREVDSWSYRFDDDDNIVDASEEHKIRLEEERVQRKVELLKKRENTESERVQMLKVIVLANPGIVRSELRSRLMEELDLGSSTIEAFISHCEKNEIIKISKTKEVVLAPDCPNTVSQQQLPFS